MKRHYKPMLAQQADIPFTSKDWIFEIKWDGIRAISYVNEELSIKSRNDQEIKPNFPELTELKSLIDHVVLDGEIVVMQEGKPDFQALLERSRPTSARDIQFMSHDSPATYIVFDMLEKNGEPLINLPLIERKKKLKEYLKEGRYVLLSVYVEEEGETYYEAALKSGVEGIMAKKKDSLYTPGQKSSSWLKIKKATSCDCVLFGYTTGEGARKETFGALLLGLFDNGKPIYVGKVGTGFSDRDMEILTKTFQGLRTMDRTIDGVDIPQKITWLKPELVCEIAYQTVTKDKKLRMPRFRGLRDDKKPSECTVDQIDRSDLSEYVAKRNFNATPEPIGGEKKEAASIFVVQKHHARRLHYDFRLEKEGALKSWAVPKEPPTVSGVKRLAIQVEDHPLEYSKFEGTIPEGEYGAGTVEIWDKGSYQLKFWREDMIEVILSGERLKGRYVLAKFKKAGEKEWLLLKARD